MWAKTFDSAKEQLMPVSIIVIKTNTKNALRQTVYINPESSIKEIQADNNFTRQ